MLFDDPLDADVKTTVSRVRRADAFPGRPRPIDAFERGQEAIEGLPVAGIAQEPIEPQHGTPFHPARFITGNSRDFPWFIIPARLALSRIRLDNRALRFGVCREPGLWRLRTRGLDHEVHGPIAGHFHLLTRAPLGPIGELSRRGNIAFCRQPCELVGDHLRVASPLRIVRKWFLELLAAGFCEAGDARPAARVARLALNPSVADRGQLSR